MSKERKPVLVAYIREEATPENIAAIKHSLEGMLGKDYYVLLVSNNERAQTVDMLGACEMDDTDIEGIKAHIAEIMEKEVVS